MKEQKNKDLAEDIVRVILLWTIGMTGGLFFSLFRLLGRVKIVGYEKRKFVPPKEGLVVIFNHPSLWEPVTLPFLFFPWFLFSVRMISFSCPDRKNYYDKLWFLPFRLFCIPIERGELGQKKTNFKNLKGLRRLTEKLKQGKIILLSPEGGRTYKGDEFKSVNHKGEIAVKKIAVRLVKENGELEIVFDTKRTVRRFERGVFWLIRKNQPVVLPIWIEGGEEVVPNKSPFGKTWIFRFPKLWKKIRITVGEPKKAAEIKNKEELEDLLLELANK